jgi:hypothetical protein
MVKMSEEDIKLAAVNGGTMILSFSNIENTLKIILLLVSIVYTVYKIYELYEQRKKK